MEKTWDDFWTSGKITDYLAYKDIVTESMQTQKEQKEYGTVRECDGNGFNSHAY